MKTKNFSKKLRLSKKTIAHLNDKEMKDVNKKVGTGELYSSKSVKIRKNPCNPWKKIVFPG